MKAIVAVYDNWGIGKDGTQPVALSADRKFFRKMTAGATVIVGRKTLLDFPGSRPLPKRRNIVLSRSDIEIDGAEIAHSPKEAFVMSQEDENVFVIGGGTVYSQMLEFCDTVFVTKVHTDIDCDTFFYNLDLDEQWSLCEVLESGTEDGIDYEMCKYELQR